MALRTITKKVIDFSIIPEELEKPGFLEEAEIGSHIECHIDEEDCDDELSQWLINRFPVLIDEESFFIYKDC